MRERVVKMRYFGNNTKRDCREARVSQMYVSRLGERFWKDFEDY